MGCCRQIKCFYTTEESANWEAVGQYLMNLITYILYDPKVPFYIFMNNFTLDFLLCLTFTKN